MNLSPMLPVLPKAQEVQIAGGDGLITILGDGMYQHFVTFLPVEVPTKEGRTVGTCHRDGGAAIVSDGGGGVRLPKAVGFSMVMAAVSWVPNMVHAPARAAISTAAITRSAIIAFLCLTEEDESASFDIQSSFSETIIFIYSFLAHRGRLSF